MFALLVAHGFVTRRCVFSRWFSSVGSASAVAPAGDGSDAASGAGSSSTYSSHFHHGAPLASDLTVEAFQAFFNVHWDLLLSQHFSTHHNAYDAGNESVHCCKVSSSFLLSMLFCSVLFIGVVWLLFSFPRFNRLAVQAQQQAGQQPLLPQQPQAAVAVRQGGYEQCTHIIFRQLTRNDHCWN